MSEVRLQVCGCLWKDLSGERQLALTQQQKEKRRREAGTGWGRRPVGERKQDLGEEVLGIGDQVGVIGEVCGRGCGRGGWYYQEKEFQVSWGVERIGWVMGLWGPGEGGRVGATQETRGRACRSKAVEAEVEPTYMR